MAVETHGLNHLALAVRDPDRSARFYREVFGVREYYRDEDSVQVVGPGPHDVIAFERADRSVGKQAGIRHFGFRLVRPGDLEAAARAIERAGGTVEDRGAFAPGMPYLFFRDPDGYLVELWFE